MSGEFDYPCPRCQVGFCQHSLAPFLSVHDNVLISVPDMPIWTCDFCGYHEFEREALSRLDAQLKQGASEARRKPAKVTSAESRTTRRPKP